MVGRVLDPQRKPVAHASVMVYAPFTASIRLDAPVGGLYVKEIGQAASSDGLGRIRADVPPPRRLVMMNSVWSRSRPVLARVGRLDSDAEQPAAESLRRERVIHGRLFDLLGQPARDVKLSVTAIRRVRFRLSINFFREGFEGPAFWWTHPDDMPGWPGPAISDDSWTVHAARHRIGCASPSSPSLTHVFTTRSSRPTRKTTFRPGRLSIALQPAGP